MGKYGHRRHRNGHSFRRRGHGSPYEISRRNNEHHERNLRPAFENRRFRLESVNDDRKTERNKHNRHTQRYISSPRRQYQTDPDYDERNTERESDMILFFSSHQGRKQIYDDQSTRGDGDLNWSPYSPREPCQPNSGADDQYTYEFSQRGSQHEHIDVSDSPYRICSPPDSYDKSSNIHHDKEEGYRGGDDDSRSPRYLRQSDEENTCSDESEGVTDSKLTAIRRQARKDELASLIVRRLLRHGNDVSLPKFVGSVVSDHIYSEIKKISQEGTIEGFLKDYKHVFVMNEDESGEDGELKTTVSYQSSLQICRIHGNKAGSCKEQTCKDLHICKYYIMSTCERHGPQCLFGHKLRSQHNEQALMYYHLDQLHDREIKEYLKDWKIRRGLTIPQTCTFYNARGCDKETHCSFLHVCDHYIKDSCHFGPNCKRRHCIRGNHSEDLLKKYGLLSLPEIDIKEFLKRRSSNEGQVNSHIPFGACFLSSMNGTQEKEIKSPSWLMFTSEKKLEKVSDKDHEELETAYQKYKKASEYSLSIGGQKMIVNFARMEGSIEGDTVDDSIGFIRN